MKGRMLQLCSDYEFTKGTHTLLLRVNYGVSFLIFLGKMLHDMESAACFCVELGGTIQKTGLDCICHINGLVQERHNSSALTMELCLSCINPSILT